MVLIARKGEPYSFILPDDQAEKLGLEKGKEYELAEVKKGLFVLYESKVKKTAAEFDNHIFALLREKSLSERVEGKFEELLNEGERARLKELISEGRVVPFKLNERYRKAVYKTREEIEASQPPTATSKTKEGKAVTRTERETLRPVILPRQQPQKPEEKQHKSPTYSLEKDSFTVISSEEEVKKICREMKDQIRRREILGTKSFDGDYFVIKSSLYDKHAPAILNLIRNNSPMTLSALSEKLRLDRQLVKAICEFLREDGEITEKRKEIYAPV